MPLAPPERNATSPYPLMPMGRFFIVIILLSIAIIVAMYFYVLSLG